MTPDVGQSIGDSGWLSLLKYDPPQRAKANQILTDESDDQQPTGLGPKFERDIGQRGG